MNSSKLKYTYLSLMPGQIYNPFDTKQQDIFKFIVIKLNFFTLSLKTTQEDTLGYTIDFYKILLFANM